MSDLTVAQKNQNFLNRIDAGGMDKEAESGVLEYTRKRIREAGILRRIMTGMTPTRDMYSRRVDSELPVVVIDFEPDSPGGMQMSINGLPPTRYIRAEKYEVRPRRYTTPTFQKNVDELVMYTLDLRQIFADNAIKDMLATEDREYIATHDALIGAEGSTVAATGSVQNKVLYGGITRESTVEMISLMPGFGDYSLPTDTILVNNVTVFQFLKWGREETGGDMAERLYREGYKETTIFGVRIVITNKRKLVPNNVCYTLAPEKFRGKLLLFQDSVLRLKRENMMITFSGDEMIGCTLANTAAFGRVRFAA